MASPKVALEANVAAPREHGTHKVTWYRSTYWNCFILGLCNFLAPGIWGAMNSLGAGGMQRPYLVNAANAISFSLMVLSCLFSSTVVHYIGVKYTLILGAMGYAPYAAGLYTNNKFGTEWSVLLGAVLCGLGAGLFWMSEAAIALSYPEPYNKGRFLGFWLSFRLAGQVLGGAINLGINADRSEAGSVSYAVYLVFIALQSLGPFIGLLISKPENVQRTDGLKVKLSVDHSPWSELKSTAKLFTTKKYLLTIPFIAQGIYTEAVMFTFSSLWFSVRVRALGSFLSGVVAIISGNLLGAFLDYSNISIKKRARYAFVVVATLQGGWFIWATILVTGYKKSLPTFDWVDSAFGSPFACFLFLIIGFQLNYMFFYFIVGNLAESSEEVVRISALLRGTESAVQAVSYGLNSLESFAADGAFYLNFGLWGISLYPAWLVIRQIGIIYNGPKETGAVSETDSPESPGQPSAPVTVEVGNK
ncbi:unnamed protein product [Clonostachys solani]|uniref:Uncharacterized protein n=1 Tax=Clonostachys solani TaxID=160281 RepID=A0A9N9ZDL6_9HYPO|nr:unnamed protein product [Clonostachys solani]